MFRGSLPGLFAAVTAAAALTTSIARASPPPSLDVRGFEPPSDAKGSLYLEPAATPGHLLWSVGAWASYANRLIVVEDAAGTPVATPVRHQLSLDYVAALGLTDRLALGLVLPTVVYQTGDDVRGLFADQKKLPTTALGDLALTVKAALLPAGPVGGFALSALGRLTLPTGDRTSYVSDSSASGELRALAELNLILLSVRATAGVRVRGGETRLLGDQFGNGLPWGAALSLMPQAFGVDRDGHFLATLEAHGDISLASHFAARRQSPSQLGLSLRYTAADLALTLGGELPLTDAVGAPRVRAVLAIAYAPRVVDTDGDGIPDSKDQCAELAEDKDGFEDSDGCPDFDNDGDGVPDDTDKCPKEQEDSDGFQDDDGCADPDNDHDGVPDAQDKCPNDPGPSTGAERGCPAKDRDLDGIPDNQDKCPGAPEDHDAYQDEDGCPDPDNDADGVRDEEDRCPQKQGEERSEPNFNGCPSPDSDADTFDDREDRCPDRAEDFDGQDDGDGCPDNEGSNQPLAQIENAGGHLKLVLRTPLAFDKDGNLDAKSTPVVRAIAQRLNERPEISLMVGVRPVQPGADGEQLALNHSFAVVEELRRFTHRDAAAETIGFAAVKRLPGAESGIGFLVLAPPAAAPAVPAKKP